MAFLATQISDYFMQCGRLASVTSNSRSHSRDVCGLCVALRRGGTRAHFLLQVTRVGRLPRVVLTSRTLGRHFDWLSVAGGGAGD